MIMINLSKIKNTLTFGLILAVLIILYGCPPVIKRFAPESGGEGTPVTIEGNNFEENASDNTVKFGGQPVPTPEIMSSSKTEIQAKVPVGARTGLITVKTDRGTGESDKNFIVPSGQASWTFMVYLDADNNLEPAGLDDFLEMASVGSSPFVNIVVQMDRHPAYTSDYGDWTGTRRFLIQNNDTPDVAPVQDLGEQNMGDPAVLQDFVEWSVTNYPADHYALSIWNHGDGWREIQRDLIRRAERAMERAQPDTGVSRAVCTDSTDADILYMREVQTALETAKNNLDSRLNTSVKLDVVGFDACLMGMLEVAYALRNVANVVVGSEDTEPFDGWPYDDILEELVLMPSYTPEDLGDIIVTKYVASYGPSIGITQSAVRVSEIDNVSLHVDAFTVVANTDWAAIRTARNNTQGYHRCALSCWGADLWDLADEIQNRTASVPIQTACQGLKTAIDNFVISEAHSADMVKSNGVAIYFPPNLTAFNNDPDHSAYNDANLFMPVDFVILHRWDNWLQSYYSAP